MLTFLGGGRGCAGALTRPSTRHLLPKNFEKTALRKRVGIFTVKMRGGHIYRNYCTQYPNFWDQKRICVKSFWCHCIANVLQNQCKLYCDQEQHVTLYDQRSTVWSRSGAGQMEGNSQRAANPPPLPIRIKAPC